MASNGTIESKQMVHKGGKRRILLGMAQALRFLTRLNTQARPLRTVLLAPLRPRQKRGRVSHSVLRLQIRLSLYLFNQVMKICQNANWFCS
jgi:hypothetical protein